MTMRQFSDNYPTVDEVLDSHIDEIPRLSRPVMLVLQALSTERVGLKYV